MKSSRSAMAHLEIISAEVSRSLKKLTQYGIALYDIQQTDELTVQVFVRSADYKEAVYLLSEIGADVKLLNATVHSGSGAGLLKRPVLMIGCLLLLFLSVVLSKRIFFVRIVGNSQVPSRMIQQYAANSGVQFGVSSRSIRSEKVKNHLLESIPQLQWAGVNTNGCVATIYVEEKSSVPQYEQTQSRVTSIVAKTDGIIESITVTNGNPLCSVGQAVKAGQTLISGYTDCGILIKADQAQGDVFARTIHNISAVSLLESTERITSGKKEVHYSIKIGKKLINFDNGSGISPASCVKIYDEYVIALPGGFSLPISLIRQTAVHYETSVQAVPVSDRQEDQINAYLLSHMIAGKILQSDTQVDTDRGVALTTGRYVCSEMIGRVKNEPVLQGE